MRYLVREETLPMAEKSKRNKRNGKKNQSTSNYAFAQEGNEGVKGSDESFYPLRSSAGNVKSSDIMRGSALPHEFNLLRWR